MSVIVRNDFGAVAVNKGVMERMIIEDMLGMSGELVLCNKKGKPIKDKPTPIIDPDLFDAVEVNDKKGRDNVKINILIKSGKNISARAEEVFDKVEADFAMLRLHKPNTVSVKVRGIITDEIVKRNIDVVRDNG